MKFTKIAMITGLAVLLVSAASAQHKTASKKAPPSCPVCHMSLSAKKDKMHSVAVYTGKSTKPMYCCPGCKMPASVTTKPAAKKGAAKTKSTK